MANGVFNISKGAFVEKFRDGASNGILMLLKVAQADGTLIDHDTVAAMLAAANTEADFTNYARKTGITGTITVDDVNDRVDVDAVDQSWASAGGASNNNLVKAIFAYQESAADSGRIPTTHHDFVVMTTGGTLSAELNAAGFARAA